jgi:tRNA(Ile)-lysidine synthase
MARTGGLSPGLCERIGARLPDAPLVVALSGGADSAVLALCVTRLERRARAVTIDHGLPASAGLVAAARRIAASLGLRHDVVVVAPAAGEGPLRDVRLEALEAAAGSDEVIVTGHTADDQAETVLGNLLRGSGAAGLGGIPARRGRWARPMLDVTRAEARDAAASAGLPFVDDPDNLDPDVRRSRLRTRVIPFLEQEEGDRVGPALVRAGRLLAADDALLEDRAGRVPLAARTGWARCPAAMLATLPRPIASRVARRLLRTQLAPYPGTEADVEACLGAAGAGVATAVSGGLLVSREGPWVVLGPAETPAPPPPADLVDGLSWGAWSFSLGVAGPRLSRRSVEIATGGGAMRVRAAAPGDRLEIEIGSKPVAELLREAGIGARFRAEWPVVEVDGRMAWVVGCRTATWTAPRRGTDNVRITAREAPWTSARS